MITPGAPVFAYYYSLEYSRFYYEPVIAYIRKNGKINALVNDDKGGLINARFTLDFICTSAGEKMGIGSFLDIIVKRRSDLANKVYDDSKIKPEDSQIPLDKQ
jgi:hypothetical protein